MDYDFDAPLYCKLGNPEVQEQNVLIKTEDCLSKEQSSEKTLSQENTETTKECSLLKEENMSEETRNTASSGPTISVDPEEQSRLSPEQPKNPELELEDEKLLLKSTKKTPHRKNSITQAARQSPRLAAIAKSIRRSNASRGMLPSSGRTISGTFNSHRRSLSEGAKISNSFSRVEKKLPVARKIATVKPLQSQKMGSGPSGLQMEDVDNLSETTHYQQILNTNRQRTANAKNVKGPMKPVSTRSGPTKPVEFNFATDSRIKPKKVDDNGAVDFTKTLRSNTPRNERIQGTTKVQPFNLHSSKPKEAGQPYVSLAELNLKFHLKTPQRFRTKRLNEPELPKANKKACGIATGVTQPQTPNLTTRLRARSVDYPTREQLEEKEIEDARKHQFKAKPLNKKILEENPIKQVDNSSKNVTIPQPFDITDTRKAETKSQLGKTDKALIDSYKQLIGSVSSLACIPHGGVPSTWEKKSTEVKPFSFDTRDMEMIRKKNEKVQKIIEEDKKMAEFHAQPLPIFDGVKGLPPKKLPTQTKIQPFTLVTDIRGSTKLQTLEKQLEALEEILSQQRKFEAQPDTVLHKEPFIPAKSNKPLTDISGFSLNTDKRAEERQAFDAHLKEREDEIAARKKELEARKAAEEEAEIQEMRRQAVHKAQPIRHYKPVDVQHGILPPTIPVSPKFATEERIKARSSHNVSHAAENTSETSRTNLSQSAMDGTFVKEA